MSFPIHQVPNARIDVLVVIHSGNGHEGLRISFKEECYFFLFHVVICERA